MDEENGVICESTYSGEAIYVNDGEEECELFVNKNKNTWLFLKNMV